MTPEQELKYKNLYEEIRKARGNPQKEKELTEQLLDHMVEVGDARDELDAHACIIEAIDKMEEALEQKDMDTFKKAKKEVFRLMRLYGISN